MTGPTPGQRRLMIYRYHRRLQDGCLACGLSTIACAAQAETNGSRCCETCRHDQ